MHICMHVYDSLRRCSCAHGYALTLWPLCPCSAVKFPDVAGSVIQLLMDFLGDTNTASALDVVFFVREIMETNSRLRPTILARLLDSFTQIRSSRVCTCSLWIIGEYSHSHPNIISATEVNTPPTSPTCTPPMLYRSYVLLSALKYRFMGKVLSGFSVLSIA